MIVWNWLRSRLAGVWRHRNLGKELDRELESHLELEAEEQEESGLPPDDARSAARRAFGNTSLVQEDVHEIWNAIWLE